MRLANVSCIESKYHSHGLILLVCAFHLEIGATWFKNNNSIPYSMLSIDIYTYIYIINTYLHTYIYTYASQPMKRY